MKIYKLLLIYFVLLFVLQDCSPKTSAANHGPYISSVTKNSIVISWCTDCSTSSTINYGLTSECDSILYDSSLTKFHKIKIMNLKPSTIYYYRVILNPKEKSENFTFKTAPKENQNFTFVAYGDTRTNPEAHLSVMQKIKEVNPSFILNVGDLVSNGNKESDWEEYFKVICDKTNVAAEVPIYSALGNHEKESKYYYDYFELPHNNSENTEAYYSFDYGSSHIICLDTEIPFDKNSKQYLWLNEDLEENKDASWKFVFLHRPIYSSSGHGGNEELKQFIEPLFQKYKVDIVFAGHDHCYERTVPIDGVTYIVTGGGGAPLYSVGKNNWTAYSESVHHFCKVNVDSSKLTISMIRSNGTIGDSFVISK